jgi:hypothetical protein
MYTTTVIYHLDSVPYSCPWSASEFLSIGGAMFGDHRRVSIVRVVALLFLLVAIGDGCFSLVCGVVGDGVCTLFLVFPYL